MNKIFLIASIAILTLFSCKQEPIDFTFTNGAEPQSLDPHFIEGVPESRINSGLFEALVSPDPKDNSAVPAVADTWEISEDRLTYTFHIRDGITWSDGVPITAQTVYDSWKRILNPETAAPYAWFPALFIKGAAEYNQGTAGLESVQMRVIDDSTFQFDLVGPLPYALNALSHYSFGIVPIHAIKKFGPAWIQPKNFVGNGPFVLEKWVPQSKIIIRKNDLYWDKDKVALNRIAILPVESDSTAYNMFQSQEADWIVNVPSEQLDAAKLNDAFHLSEQLASYYVLMQNSVPPLDNPLVRQALSLAVDRTALTESVLKGGELPAFGVVPTLPGYKALEGETNVAKAQELLAEAGYPNGEGLPTIEYSYNTNERHKSVGEFLQQQWKENLGINIELVNYEWKTFLSIRDEGDYQLARAGWVGDYADPNTFLDQYTSSSAADGTHFMNKEYDDLLLKASQMADGPERQAMLRQADQIISQDAAALLPLYYYTTTNMIDTDVWGGWYTNIQDRHPLKYLYKK